MSQQRTRLLWRAAGALVVLALVLAGCADDDKGQGSAGGSNSTEQRSDAALRLNQIQVLGTHNSYHVAPEPRLMEKIRSIAAAVPEVTEGLGDPASLEYTHLPLDEQLDAGLRTFELDIAADPTGGTFATPKGPSVLGVTDPVVPTDMDAPGIKVFHIVDIDQISTCQTLVICLQTVKAWSDAHEAHEPIVIQLELKNDGLPKPFDLTPVTPFGAKELDDLDAEVRSVFDDDRLITPDLVRGDASDLRTAVTTKGWPALDDVRGRVMFYLDNSGASSDAYREGHPSLEGRVAFTSDRDDLPSSAVLVKNDPKDPSIPELVKEGFLVRTRADADLVEAKAGDASSRDAAFASGAQLIHSDYPQGEPREDNGYVVSFGTKVGVRCNPVTFTRDRCPLPKN